MMNPWRDIRGLSKEVWFVCSTVLINRMGTMVLPFLVLYFTQALQFSEGQAGLLLALYGFGALIAGPLGGRLSDRVGASLIMKASLFSAGTLLLCISIIQDFYLLAVLVFLLSVSSEAFRPAMMSILSGMVSKENRRSAFALNRLAVNIGMSIGPLVGGFLSTVSFAALFWVDGVTSLLAGFLLLFAKLKTPENSSSTLEENGTIFTSEKPYQNISFLFFLLATFFSGVVFFQLGSTMPLFLVENLGFLKSDYGMLFTINTVLIVFFEIPISTATKQWSYRFILPFGAILVGLGFGLLAFARSFWEIGATIVVWTVGEMLLLPALPAYVAEISPSSQRGVYMGFFSMSFGLAFAIAPWLGILVLEQFGGTILWSGVFGVSILSATLLAFVKQETPQDVEIS